LIEVQRQAAAVIRHVFAGQSLTRALSALRDATLPANSRAAIQDISYGVLRHYGLFSSLLDLLLTRNVKEDLRDHLVVALYQLTFTRAKPYAVVDSAVEAGGGARTLINAVLRRYLREKTELLAQARRTEFGAFSYPQWWIDRIKAQYPEQFISILDAGKERPPLTLRVNARRISVTEYLSSLLVTGAEAVQIGERAVRLVKPVPVESIPGFAEGLVSVHDAGAQLAAPLLDARDGMRVLDACAAPGGKTAHLLELSAIDLTALDRDEERLEKVRENLRRLKLSAHVVCGDAGSLAWWDGEAFDRILLDAPCTGSGVVRRHPDIKWLRRPSDIDQSAREQTRLLDTLWHVLKQGGKLLYATCSVFAEENTGQIEAFLKRHDDAELLPLDRLESRQLVPTDQHDGFYYALVEKRA
jgi:16S rRNA (cytosine967-C5)-methyltransferase